MPKFLLGLTTFFIVTSFSHSAYAESLTSPSGDLVFQIFPNAPYKVPEAGLKLENELTFTTSKYAVGNIQVDLVGPGDGFYQEVISKVDGPGGYYVETPNTFWPITILASSLSSVSRLGVESTLPSPVLCKKRAKNPST